jgi:hypothetical protein
MDVLTELRFIERQKFFNGQRLLADDLQYLEAFNREMRWLHNRSLHVPGIGSGLKVYGEKGDREVVIGPGYALDNLGREIILTEEHRETIPPVKGEGNDAALYDLVISFDKVDDLKVSETRRGECDASGAVRRSEAPVFCWARLEINDLGEIQAREPRIRNDINDKTRIILARIKVKNCQLHERISITERRSARPGCPEGPNIVCSSEDGKIWGVTLYSPEADTDPPNVSLAAISNLAAMLATPAEAKSKVSGTLFLLKADVNTSRAGFRTDETCYTVSIPGPRQAELEATFERTFTIDALVTEAEEAKTAADTAESAKTAAATAKTAADTAAESAKTAAATAKTAADTAAESA